ncbi:Kinase, CAMK CAMK-Unique [Spironucleus salmonicida]|uniref:Kinase, CAMK CAMK-Unique n=1 Tax=Spironucleus salmonicida TaxID=348837 RepID=V6LP11_9EUKA|nr:Kinase, CAMK CAMK-Unique [Spironucleus salmonicida]|eukprot:EST46340.1 Kinase, CAMK CAMK-Unique [Spironucleus salmonicida]
MDKTPQPSASKRAQRQSLVNEIRERLENGDSRAEILSLYDAHQHTYLSKLIAQLQEENTTEAPAAPRTGHIAPKIDKFLRLKTSPDALISSMREQIQQLKGENGTLRAQLISIQNQFSTPNQLLNKINLALRLHEFEAQEIASRYANSRQFDPIQPNSPSQKELENQNEIRDQEAFLQTAKLQLEAETTKSGKLALQLHIGSLNERLVGLRRLHFQLVESSEIAQIDIKRYKNLTVNNSFRSFNLPCFYPTFPLQQHPLRSSFPIQFPPQTPQFLLLRKLGSGGFSSVFKAFNLQKSTFSALKISTFGAETHKKLTTREAEIHKKLAHKNVLQVHQILKFDTEIAIEMEICDGLSLHEFICLAVRRCQYQEKLTQNEAVSIILQISEALVYLHRQGVVHNDISLMNILQSAGAWKLADFTLAKEAFAESPVTTLGMTCPYAAPERFRRVFSAKSDVYSLGVVGFLLLTGYIEFFNRVGKMLQMGQQGPDIASGARDYFKMHGSVLCDSGDELRELICAMLGEDAAARPTAMEVSQRLEGLVKGKKVRR